MATDEYAFAGTEIKYDAGGSVISTKSIVALHEVWVVELPDIVDTF